MGLSIQFPKLLKNTSSFKEEQNEKTSKTPLIHNISTHSSPAPSIIASNGYIRDPTRCGNQPSILGQYYDPMGGKFTYTQGKDATNTGA